MIGAARIRGYEEGGSSPRRSGAALFGDPADKSRGYRLMFNSAADSDGRRTQPIHRGGR